jgi:hypothetical protein
MAMPACLHELKDDKLKERLKVGEAQPSYLMAMARGLNNDNPYAASNP